MGMGGGETENHTPSDERTIYAVVWAHAIFFATCCRTVQYTISSHRPRSSPSEPSLSFPSPSPSPSSPSPIQLPAPCSLSLPLPLPAHKRGEKNQTRSHFPAMHCMPIPSTHPTHHTTTTNDKNKYVHKKEKKKKEIPPRARPPQTPRSPTMRRTWKQPAGNHAADCNFQTPIVGNQRKGKGNH